MPTQLFPAGPESYCFSYISVNELVVSNLKNKIENVLNKAAESHIAGDLQLCFASRYNRFAANDVTREES